jgi:hypothetical protein
MTKSMCGTETSNSIGAAVCGAGNGRWKGAMRSEVSVRRITPLQGGDGCLGPGSQDVALGYRVEAPLARAAASDLVSATVGANCVRAPLSFPQPEGLLPVSPGQRPGDRAPHKGIPPERVNPGSVPATARSLEQTVADNVAEILEA